MNMKIFNPGGPQQEAGPKKTPAEKAPESGRVEQKGDQENLESRYDELDKEAQAIERDREINFQLSALQSEGLQTLINEYGADSVFEAIKKQFELKNQDNFSIFEVIKELEPDRARRSDLYEKMNSDAEEQAEKLDREEELRDTKKTESRNHFFDGMYGSSENFVRSTQFCVKAMKGLDSALGKIAPQSYYLILGSCVDKFASYVSQFTEEGAKLKGELGRAGNDIFRLVEERARTADERTKALYLQVNELRDELAEKIQNISDDLRAELEEFRTRVTGDLDKIRNLEITSEEMRAALQDVLQKMEAEITRRAEATEKKISDETARLREMTEKAASIKI